MRKSAWVVVCLVIAACGGKKPTEPSSTPQPLTTFVAGADTIGAAEATAVVRTGNPPAGGSFPRPTVNTDGPVAANSSNLLSITSPAPFRTVYVSISGGPTQVNDYLQIDLPSPQTSVDVRVRFGATLPSWVFDFIVQTVGTDGSVSGNASASKTPVTAGPVVVIAVVYSTCTRSPTGIGPCSLGPPVAGARVSSSLDSTTATTNANGVFELRTSTPFQPPMGQCFTLTVSAPGFATYSAPGWRHNGQSPDVHRIVLSPPMPAQGTSNCP